MWEKMTCALQLGPTIDADFDTKRSQAYDGISARFGFLRNVRSMSSEEQYLQSAVVEWFADDLDASLSGELVQFAALLDNDIGRQATSIAS